VPKSKNGAFLQPYNETTTIETQTLWSSMQDAISLEIIRAIVSPIHTGASHQLRRASTLQ